MIFSFLQFPMRTFGRLCSVLRMRKLLVPMATPLFSSSKPEVLWGEIYVLLCRTFSSLADFSNRLITQSLLSSPNWQMYLLQVTSGWSHAAMWSIRLLPKFLLVTFAHVLSNIISPMQNAFLGGKLMSDNINLVQELLRQYNRKRPSPRCLMKVDFWKAFDSVQWNFIGDLLR
jgi:hypothetical protein